MEGENREDSQLIMIRSQFESTLDLCLRLTGHPVLSPISQHLVKDV